MAEGPIPGSNGGTGVDNGSNTMSLTGGNIALTLTGNSDLTLPAGTHTIPTATGGGASGTWPISISGSSGSASTTFQQTYNNGIAGGLPGWCQIDPGKPFIIQNFAFGTDQETFGIATSKNPGLGSNLIGCNFYGFDGASTFIKFGRVQVENVVRTPGAEYGNMSFQVKFNGTDTNWFDYNSQTNTTTLGISGSTYNLPGTTASRLLATDVSKNLIGVQYTTTNTASAVVQRDASSYIFATGLNLSKNGGAIVSDYITLSDTSRIANEKNWGMGVSASKMLFYTQNDAQSSSTTWLEVSRSANSIGTMTFPAGNVVISSSTSSTTPTTGALVVTGGVGISGNVNTAGIVTLPQNLTFSTNITSNATVPSHRVKIVANEAIAIGEILKVSAAVDFRVEKMKTTDATSVSIIGVAATASAGAGDVIEVFGMNVFPVITNSVTTRGNLLARSGVVPGRVSVSAAGAGVFAVALQSGAVGDTILATLKWSETF